MSAAFELAVATYILIRLQLADPKRFPAQPWRLAIVGTMAAVCVVCWIAIVVEAVRAAVR